MPKIYQALLISAIFLPTIASAQFSSSTNFQIQAGVIDSSGGYSSSSNFQLFGNIPYIESGNTQSSNFQINVGFPFSSNVSAISVSSVGNNSSGSVGGLYVPIVTASSTDISSYIAIIQSIQAQVDALFIQPASKPSIVFDSEEGLPSIEIVDIFDTGDREDKDIIRRRIPILDFEIPQVTEIYKDLVQKRFIPSLIVLIIVILIFFRRRA